VLKSIKLFLGSELSGVGAIGGVVPELFYSVQLIGVIH